MSWSVRPCRTSGLRQLNAASLLGLSKAPPKHEDLPGAFLTVLHDSSVFSTFQGWSLNVTFVTGIGGKEHMKYEFSGSTVSSLRNSPGSGSTHTLSNCCSTNFSLAVRRRTIHCDKFTRPRDAPTRSCSKPDFTGTTGLLKVFPLSGSLGLSVVAGVFGE